MLQPPVVSPDGLWRWDGTRWQPMLSPAAASAIPHDANFAGFWIRFFAYVIDAVVINAMAIPLNLLLFGNSGTLCGASPHAVTSASDAATGRSYFCLATGPSVLIFWLLGLAYFVFLWSRGATLGQRMARLRVVDGVTGGLLPLSRCLVRYVGFFLAALLLAIGLIWAGVDSRKQGWHDKIAQSLVLRDFRR